MTIEGKISSRSEDFRRPKTQRKSHKLVGILAKVTKDLLFFCISLSMLLPPEELDISCGLWMATSHGSRMYWVLGSENIQSILFIYQFCICEFAYSLKFICDPQINTHDLFSVIHRHAQSSKKLSACSQLMWNRGGFAFLLQVLFTVYLVPCFLYFCAFCC